MRLLPAFIKCAYFILFLVWLSCASTPPSIKSEEKLIIVGRVTVTGDFPSERQIALLTGNGVSWILINPDLEDEFARLSGHDVQVAGVVTVNSRGGATVLVERYEMMPVAGKTPIIGTLVPDGERLNLVESGMGKRYVLKGRLRNALMNFIGLKVWVWGDAVPSDGVKGGTVSYLNVEGYGILGLPEHITRPVISDTLQDFRNR